MRGPLSIAAALAAYVCAAAPVLAAPAGQQPVAATPVAAVSTHGVTLTGVTHTGEGLALLGNNASIAAGSTTADLTLARGGRIAVCTGTTMHIAREVPPHPSEHPGDAGLLLSLDHGSLEGHYTPGAFADEIMTPDLRLLISAPGIANYALRVNADGDTCFDNAGANAPYVIASSLTSGGIYRVQPGQRVLFVGGSLSRVVDNEHEPCGCPAAVPGGTDANAFPLAISEGLEPAPMSTAPVVPEGVTHTQVTATLDANTPPGPPPPEQHVGFFHRLGRAIKRLFGGR